MLELSLDMKPFFSHFPGCPCHSHGPVSTDLEDLLQKRQRLLGSTRGQQDFENPDRGLACRGEEVDRGAEDQLLLGPVAEVGPAQADEEEDQQEDRHLPRGGAGQGLRQAQKVGNPGGGQADHR